MTGAWIRRPLQRVCRLAVSAARSGTICGAAIVSSANCSIRVTGAPPAKCSHQARSTSRRSNELECAVRPSGPTSASIVRSISPRTTNLGWVRPTTASIASASTPEAAACVRHRSIIATGADPVVLRLARIQRGDLRGARAMTRRVAASAASISTRRVENARNTAIGNAFEIGDAVHDRTPPHTEPMGQLEPQVRLIQIAGGLGMQVEVTAVERRPPAIRPPRHVRDQHVRVEMWVAGPARPVPERRPDEPVTRNLVDAIGAAPRPTRRPFQISERRVDRGVVRARAPARRSRTRPRPNRTDTDFGARNVRSNPGT